MEMMLVLVIFTVAFFIWQGFRTRCPQCGDMALHPRDNVAEQSQREMLENMKAIGLLDTLDQAGSKLGSVGSVGSKPSYVNSYFKCKACGHSFKRSKAIEWLTIRNKLSEKKALDEYKKLKS